MPKIITKAAVRPGTAAKAKVAAYLKSRNAKKPCAKPLSEHRKRTAVAIHIVSQLRFLFGGGGGSRTRVRKRFNRTFSGRSQDSGIPSAQGHLTDLAFQ